MQLVEKQERPLLDRFIFPMRVGHEFSRSQGFDRGSHKRTQPHFLVPISILIRYVWIEFTRPQWHITSQLQETIYFKGMCMIMESLIEP